MLKQNRIVLAIAGAVFLAIVVLGFNFLGDGLRDAIDPRLIVPWPVARLSVRGSFESGLNCVGSADATLRPTRRGYTGTLRPVPANTGSFCATHSTAVAIPWPTSPVRS